MQRTSFGPWSVDVDATATSVAYKSVASPDPACCNACATFREVLRTDSLPSVVMDFLQDVGADPARPQEVWGAPESGFLAGWWIIVGRLPNGPWDGGPNGAIAEPAPGFMYWLTDEVIRQSWPKDIRGPLLQLEFSWESPILIDLEGLVWPRAKPPA